MIGKVAPSGSEGREIQKRIGASSSPPRTPRRVGTATSSRLVRIGGRGFSRRGCTPLPVSCALGRGRPASLHGSAFRAGHLSGHVADLERAGGIDDVGYGVSGASVRDYRTPAQPSSQCLRQESANDMSLEATSSRRNSIGMRVAAPQAKAGARLPCADSRQAASFAAASRDFLHQIAPCRPSCCSISSVRHFSIRIGMCSRHYQAAHLLAARRRILLCALAVIPGCSRKVPSAASIV